MSASSGLPVTVASTTPLMCRAMLAGAAGTVTAIDPGTCALTAGQAGNAAYLPAESVIRTFIVEGVL